MSSGKNYLGIGKTKYFSSVCYIPEGQIEKMQIWQTERLTRKKNSGAWPFEALKEFQNYAGESVELIIAENRDVETPAFFENFYNEQFPFYDYLRKQKLERFSSKFNPDIKFVSHHEAHAYAALAMSPFQKSIIVVMDGAGSKAKDVKGEIGSDLLEECSVYLQDGVQLKAVLKRWINHRKDNHGHIQTDGIGGIYELCSQFIFNDPNSSGKVMGLAPLGKAKKIEKRSEFLAGLKWNHSFKEKTKKDWEESSNQNYFREIAASVQEEFEKDYQSLISKLLRDFPEYDNLILAGGCALNCTNNAKLYEKKLFKNIYVLPFPGDDGIALGCASYALFSTEPNKWKPFPMEKQVSYWGPVSSDPEQGILVGKLSEMKIDFEVCDDFISKAAIDLAEGKVLGWFQGRSESGPRALGNRSILCRPDRSGIKNYLNKNIKFREEFRPYGCSVLQEKASEYFEVDSDFENSFMSFAVKVKPKYEKVLMEVSHVDKTSRMQTIRETQNTIFYNLINSFGKITNLYCLLNTSLNIMGEPIVETIDDAIRFFETTPVDVMYIGKIRLLRSKEMFQDLERIKKDVETADQFISAKGFQPASFCVVPFTNIILEPDGSVGICRQKGNNFPIGNIKQNSISEIWNNDKIKSWRREFLEGKPVTCKVDIKHEQCNRCTDNNKILPYVQFSEVQTGPILKLTANFNGKCNLQCQMCDIWQLPNGLYDEINFWEPAKLEIFPFLKEIDMLSGEPLIQPDTFRLIDEVTASNKDCEWTITSNIHWQFNKKIRSAFDQIKLKTLIVSIDSLIPEVYAKIRKPGRLALVLNTLEDILNYRKEEKDFDIRMNFLIQKDNWKEAFSALEFCYEKRINPFITFLYEPVEFSLLTEEETVRKEILDFYFTSLNPFRAVHLKRILMPLIESLPVLDRAHYFLELNRLLSDKPVKKVSL